MKCWLGNMKGTALKSSLLLHSQHWKVTIVHPETQFLTYREMIKSRRCLSTLRWLLKHWGDWCTISIRVRFLQSHWFVVIFSELYSKYPCMFTNGKNILQTVSKDSLTLWMNYLTSQPRAASLLTEKHNTLVSTLQNTMEKYLGDVKVMFYSPDKRDPEFVFYDVTKTVLNVHRYEVFLLFRKRFFKFILDTINHEQTSKTESLNFETFNSANDNFLFKITDWQKMIGILVWC